jgi:hypothetical protein
MSFHVPRRGQPGDSPKFNTTPQRNASSSTPPQIPPKSRARARAYTSPETERLAERIASAILEKEKLQELIDEAIERQSIYLGGSRPSTAHSMAFSTLPGELFSSFFVLCRGLVRNRPSVNNVNNAN